MKKTLLIWLGIIACCFTLPTYSQSPQKTFTICKGENEVPCQGSTYHIGCNDSEIGLIEQTLCVIHNPDGSTSKQKYMIEMISIEAGNKCGYTKWRATCFGG